MVAKARTIKLGDPLDRATKMGPLVTAKHRERVAGFVEVGRQEGARLVLGGTAPALGASWRAARTSEPTIFYDVAPNIGGSRGRRSSAPWCRCSPSRTRRRRWPSPTARPTAWLARVWTRDIFRAFRVVKKLRAGIVWVNHMQPTYVEAPWGGYKMSGQGRELGRHGIEAYLEAKQVHVNLSEKPIGWY